MITLGFISCNHNDYYTHPAIYCILTDTSTFQTLQIDSKIEVREVLITDDNHSVFSFESRDGRTWSTHMNVTPGQSYSLSITLENNSVISARTRFPNSFSKRSLITNPSFVWVSAFQTNEKEMEYSHYLVSLEKEGDAFNRSPLNAHPIPCFQRKELEEFGWRDNEITYFENSWSRKDVYEFAIRYEFNREMTPFFPYGLYFCHHIFGDFNPLKKGSLYSIAEVVSSEYDSWLLSAISNSVNPHSRTILREIGLNRKLSSNIIGGKGIFGASSISNPYPPIMKDLGDY